MKTTFWTIIGCLALVTGLSLYSGMTTTKITDKHLETIAQIEQLFADGNDQQAQMEVGALQKRWKKDCEILQFIAFHQDTNQVDSFLNMLLAGFETNNDTAILMALGELKDNLTNISLRETLTLVNVF